MSNANTHAPIQAIIGLGNIGAKYHDTRHNAGFWLLDAIAAHYGVQLRPESKFQGEFASFDFVSQGATRKIFLLKPSTYMNASGRAAALLCKFYKLEASCLMVAHDELDLPEGCVRLKFGGGHGGHNGLRDIGSALDNQFWRLRLGINHPGSANMVTPYVLGAPSKAEKNAIDAAIERAIVQFDTILNNDFEGAMRELHRK